MPYADTIRTTNPTFENVANLIDGQLISWQSLDISTGAAASFTAAGTVTGSTISVSVAAGESVLAMFSGGASTSATTTGVQIYIRMDGANVGSGFAYSTTFRGDTGGLDQQLTHHVVHSPAAGSHSYTLYLAGVSGTTYLRAIKFSVIKFRNS